MSSNTADRFALIGEAIDRLAAEAASAAGDEPLRVASRVAAIWAMMAELDPGLARRLRAYTDGDPGRRPPGTPGPGDDPPGRRPGIGDHGAAVAPPLPGP
ncbi:MAG: hypothetical protein J2P34_02550 [Actinobacteria bacterium]|nr:hypothetical protein [Actinomycetota bacterium]